MKHIWTIICKETIIDQNSNVVSILNAIEELTLNTSDTQIASSKEKKILPINFEIISLWSDNDIKKDRVAELRAELYDPDNQKLEEFINNFKIPKNFKRMRTRLKIAGFPITKQGCYEFKIKLRKNQEKKYKLVANIPIEIRIVKQRN